MNAYNDIIHNSFNLGNNLNIHQLMNGNAKCDTAYKGTLFSTRK